MTEEQQRDMGAKVMRGCIKTLIARPETKPWEILPDVKEFLRRTGWYDRETEIAIHLMLEDKLKQHSLRDAPLPQWKVNEALVVFDRVALDLSPGRNGFEG